MDASGTVLLTVQEAARELNLSRSQLYGMTRRGELPGCVVRVGRAVRLHRERLLRWLEAQADSAE